MHRIISRDTLAQTAPTRWADQYRNYPPDDWKHHVMVKLLELKQPISPDEVDRIIGNTSWTKVPDCDQCARPGLDFVVGVGGGRFNEYDYAHADCVLCRDCLGKVAALADEHFAKTGGNRHA